VDDSGIYETGGKASLTEKIFSAVIVPPSCASEVLSETFTISSELQRICRESLGAPRVKEFHFCDVFHGKEAFENIPLESRIGMFEFMATFVDYYLLEIVAVGWSDTRNRQLIRDFESVVQVKRIGFFNLESIEHSTFLLLVFKLRNYIRDKNWEFLPSIFCDEGIYGNHLMLVSDVPLFQNFYDGAIFFVDSAKVPGIQIADFTAFLLSRHKIALRKWRKDENLNLMDATILKLMNKLNPKYVGVPKTFETKK